MLARFRARGDARGRAACAGRGPRGDVAPCGPLCVSGSIVRRVAAIDTVGRRPGRGSMRPGRACPENGWISLFLQMVLQ